MRTVEQLRDIAKRVRQSRIEVEQEVATDGPFVLERINVEMTRRPDCQYHIIATRTVRGSGCTYKTIESVVLADALDELDRWAGMEIDL